MGDRLLLEWSKKGIWYGSTDPKYVEPYREWALEALSKTSERYVYLHGRARISFYEGC